MHLTPFCRITNKYDLIPFYSFGKCKLANGFNNETIEYDNDIYYSPSSSTLQMINHVDPSIVYTKDYSYRSGQNEPMVNHFRKLSDRLKHIITDKTLVCDIGCNDGSFLKNFEGDCDTMGIDPCLPDDIGLTYPIKDFVQNAKSVNVYNYNTKIVYCSNTLAQNIYPNDFINSIKKVFNDNIKDTLFIFEVPWLMNILDNCYFDQFYNEHTIHYSLKGLLLLMESVGLTVFRTEYIDTHGGSLRVYCSVNFPDCNTFNMLTSIEDETKTILKDEIDRGLNDINKISDYSNSIKNHVYEINRLIASKDTKIILYGAPAKSSIMIDCCDIEKYVDYCVDSTPSKIGKKIPNTNIMIKPPDCLKNESNKTVVVMAWNYYDYIINKERELIKSNNLTFINPCNI